MHQSLLALFLLPFCLPGFSQKTGAGIEFKTKEGKTYQGIVAEVGNEGCNIHFQQSGYTIRLANEKLSAMLAAKKKACFGISQEVEDLLKEEAATRIHQIFQTCSFAEGSGNQYRFCQVKGCSLFVFYTSMGYDNASLDYHLVKIDLATIQVKGFFDRQADAEKGRNRGGTPVIEIAKHTSSARYNEEEFTDVSSWSNQPEHRSSMQFYFLDKRSPAFQPALDSLQPIFTFLRQACR